MPYMSNICFFLVFLHFSSFCRDIEYIAQYEPRASGKTFDFILFMPMNNTCYRNIFVHSKFTKRTTHLSCNCSGGWI